VGVRAFDDGPHEALVVCRRSSVPFVEAGGLGNVELELDNVSVLVADGRRVPDIFTSDTGVTQLDDRNEMRSQVSQLSVVTLGQQVSRSLSEEASLIQVMMVGLEFLESVDTSHKFKERSDILVLEVVVFDPVSRHLKHDVLHVQGREQVDLVSVELVLFSHPTLFARRNFLENFLELVSGIDGHSQLKMVKSHKLINGFSLALHLEDLFCSVDVLEVPTSLLAFKLVLGQLEDVPRRLL